MFKGILLAIVCIAMVHGNMKDDLRDRAADALNEGDKVKVGLFVRWNSLDFFFYAVGKSGRCDA